MDKSWLTIPRNFEAYTTGINLFLDQAVANGVGPDKFRCPCKRCCNRYTFVRNTIVEHLILYDMDKDYKNACWRHHGEQNIGEQNVGIGEEETGDEVIGMHDFLNDVFVQPLTEEGVGPSTEPPIGEGRPKEVQTFFKLLEEADQDLWPGCKEFKKLEAVVRLYQIKCLAGMPDEIFTTLLELIKRMLPEGDCLPESCYKAKKLINDLGLSYVKIDACPNDCMIYWKDTSDLTMCSVCGKSRYKITNAEDSSREKVAAKVMWYFPLKPRLQRFFMSKHMAEHMRWHATECPKDEFMRHPSDSPAWKHLDNLYPDFASEIRNVRLGLASDGFNPFGKMRNDHSTWSVVLSVYNLPPWMCMKQPNLLLSLLIPGPRSPGKEIDVYMRPLIDELNELWEQLLLLAIRPVLPKAVTMVLLELSAIFRQLCSKKESEEGFKQLNSRIALTLCQLEKIFPPAFFDIMVHLPVHLADEAALAGPVQYRWMYPIERYLQTLRRYVRNKGRPEGSIAEAYLVDECLSFCSMYLRDVESRRTRRGRNEDGIGRGVSGGLSIFDSKGCYMGSGENVELDLNVLDQCHRYILNNCDEVSPFRRQHEEFLKTKHRREMLTMRQIKELSKKEFPEWFKQHMNSRYDANDTLISQDLHWLANYPSRVVSRYKSHIVHGFRFRIKSVDDKHKNQNCGVFVPANVPGAIGQMNCYGRVVDMFEVKYCGPTEAGDRGRAVMLFKCEWVNSESPRGMKTDQYGFTMVNFNQLGFKEDPFILASQALQAFYVEDTIEKDWHVVVRTQPRDLFDVLEDSDTIDDYAMPNFDDRILDNENFHSRVGVEETPFLESLALPTGFVNHANTDDELTDDDRE
ncbi:uncharacterized protein [Pyrus communis]|uniref:uncharacterized protein n=1 Tax=Pyrus communis TaxID=23211 RepID=UPI0035BF4990